MLLAASKYPMQLLSEPFRLFGNPHLTVLAGTAIGIVASVWLLRSQLSEHWKMLLRRFLAILLILSVLADPITMLWRGSWQNVVRDGMPLYLCDWASLVLAWVLWRNVRSPRLAVVGYLWGMSGTLAGLITPALQLEFPAPEFFGFFLQHAGVPMASAAVCWGLRYYADWSGLWLAVRCSWAYMAVAMAVSPLCLKANYGFFWAKPAAASLFDVMGPWPWYLLSLQVLGVVLFSVWLLLGKMVGMLLGDQKYFGKSS
jgi:hypothetical integral membrane protein (TIGR02206 family)